MYNTTVMGLAFYLKTVEGVKREEHLILSILQMRLREESCCLSGLQLTKN